VRWLSLRVRAGASIPAIGAGPADAKLMQWKTGNEPQVRKKKADKALFRNPGTPKVSSPFSAASMILY
jgi:hypothetical protein